MFSQTEIIINDYAKVISVSTYDVTVDNPAAFNPGDFVLLIQMKGISVNRDDAPGYGDLADIVGMPGQYEFLKIDNVVGNTISFLSEIKNYEAAGYVQLIKVPFLTSYDITKKLTCKPWNSTDGTGGVVAIINGGTLKLNADIDVTGKGFAGGAADEGLGACGSTPGIEGIYSFDASFHNAGFKGEGNASHFTPFIGASPVLLSSDLKGQGALYSGGGGGNGRFAGGGGGSNRGKGSDGGDEDRICFATSSGLAGFIVDKPSIDPISNTGGIFMGGGGGASTHLAGALSSSGGNGGGIVFIISESIEGNNHSIIASGDSSRIATGIFSGAGGGGAGGSVIIFAQNYASTNLNIKVKGSKGGDVIHSWLTGDGGGVGGAGGGGYITLLTPKTGLVSLDLSGGGQSYIKYADGHPREALSTSGTTGLLREGVFPVLTGFLFNSISSIVTGTQTDSICSGVAFSTIVGTNPIGGIPPYTYEWLSSTTSESIGYTTIPGATSKDYSPGLLTQTTWFKRIVTDNSVPVIPDESKPVKIIFQPAITGNLVGNDNTICNSQDPVALIPLNAGPSGGSSLNYYNYSWLQNNTNTDWISSSSATGVSTLASYDPPSLTVTGPAYFKRVVTSGRCIDYSSTITINVLDSLRNNKILNSPPDICFGNTFADLNATTPTTSPALTGGDNTTYRFNWENYTSGSGWVPAAGINNTSGYNPPESASENTPSNQYIYRRVTFSGIWDVCRSVSNAVLLKDFPVIKVNNIAPVLPICSGSKPADIIGTKIPTLAGGNTSYNFSWEDSTKTHSWQLISGASAADFPAIVLTDTTWYRRTVKAVCTDTSKSIQIIVHKPILNNNVSVSTGGLSQTICNNQTPVSLTGMVPTGGTNIPGDYAYLWKTSTDNLNFTSIPAGTLINYQPPSLTAATYYYKRWVRSGSCEVISNPITITVHPDIANNTISGNPKICYSLVPGVVNGAAPTGGSGVYKYLWEQSIDGGSAWTPAALTNNSSDYQPPSLTAPVKYRRKVSSGLNDCCSNISNVFSIAIDPLPAGTIYAGPDTIIYSVEKTYHMNAINPALAGNGETGAWTMLNGGTGSFDDTTKFNTVIRNLSIGSNSFLWTVRRGPCKLEDSVDIVLLNDFIPQGFSPNGDAWNNTFKIEGLNLIDQIVELIIVNGAGTEIFSTSNREGETWTDWKGTNLDGSNLPEGTYYYLLKITSDPLKGGNGKIFKRSGFIILKRY